jgi:anti-sigma-K factor RskA
MIEITEKPLQLYRMKNVRSAQAFAITLEKKGGSSTPEGSMYVMGNL